MRFNSNKSSLHYRQSFEVVRTLLAQQHPQLFRLPHLHAVPKNGKVDSFAASKHLLHKLAALNGYTKVTKIHCPVALAEGVIAVQRGNLMDRCEVYSRPSIPNDLSSNLEPAAVSTRSLSTPAGNDSDKTLLYFPPYREEDFTLYRNLENELDKYLNNKKEAWMGYFRGNPIVQLLHKLAIQLIPSKLQDDSNEFFDTTSDDERKETSLGTESNSIEPSQHTEDLLIFYQGRLVAMEQVPSEYRLLSLPPLMTKRPMLPYKLKHNTASSIIYVSFATFVALPLAYRTVKYALDYPAMVELLLASFFGTLSYSIWYSRYGARVRQQLSIEKAVGSRTVARDEAAVAYLVGGAISNVTRLVLAECGDKCNEKELEISNANPNDVVLKMLEEMNIELSTLAHEIENKRPQ